MHSKVQWWHCSSIAPLKVCCSHLLKWWYNPSILWLFDAATIAWLSHSEIARSSSYVYKLATDCSAVAPSNTNISFNLLCWYRSFLPWVKGGVICATLSAPNTHAPCLQGAKRKPAQDLHWLILPGRRLVGLKEAADPTGATLATNQNLYTRNNQ